MPITDEIAEKILDSVHEQIRLEKLTNEELVKECLLDNDLADYPIVEEMMTRLDPHWMNEMALDLN